MYIQYLAINPSVNYSDIFLLSLDFSQSVEYYQQIVIILNYTLLVSYLSSHCATLGLLNCAARNKKNVDDKFLLAAVAAAAAVAVAVSVSVSIFILRCCCGCRFSY